MKTTEPPQPETLLLPKGHGCGASNNTDDRRKSPRLKGADLYVARLGWCGDPATKPKQPKSSPALLSVAKAEHGLESTTTSDSEDELRRTDSSPNTSSSGTSSGSLHDELINRESSPSHIKASNTDDIQDTSNVRASRPCYRCISYMHSVGIKRVFWTNDAGEWEGSKIRDLVDALDNSMESVGATGSPGAVLAGKGIFVTKHEVLMLRRLMGNDI